MVQSGFDPANPPYPGWAGWLGGQPVEVPLVEIETLWTVGGEYPGHWPSPQHGWTLTIEGDAVVGHGMRIQLDADRRQRAATRR